MRRAVLSIALGILSGYAWAQDSLLIVKDGEVEKKAVLATPIELNTKAVKFVPYGFIRNDFYYDSRENFETASGLFYIIPKDHAYNALGEDVNEVSSSRFLSIAARLGLKVHAQQPILGAHMMAQLETDFAGFNGSTTMFRIRQAFARMSWNKIDVTAGQTWHPMFGDVVPNIQSLATGSPFQPFNRSPQLRFDWRPSNLRMYVAGLYQLQYTTWGPNGASTEYQTNSKVPEVYFGLDWKYNGWIVGAGADFLRVRPRVKVVQKVQNEGKESEVTHKVDEVLNSFSLCAFTQYTTPNKKFSVKAKTIYGENMAHLLLLSGYGVSKELEDGSYEYTNIKNSTSWLNITYGDVWQIGFFAGYMKNLGSDDHLLKPKNEKENTVFIFGYNNIDYVYRLSPMICYNIKRFSFGLEYEMTAVGYGDLNYETGRVENTHQVNNHRAVAVMMFNF